MCVRAVNYKQTRQANPRTQTHQSRFKANAHKEIDEILFNLRTQILNVLFVLKSALLNCSKQAIKGFFNVPHSACRVRVAFFWSAFLLEITSIQALKSPQKYGFQVLDR
jgi:hypothetical protein